jgi:hypothetical protein
MISYVIKDSVESTSKEIISIFDNNASFFTNVGVKDADDLIQVLSWNLPMTANVDESNRTVFIRPQFCIDRISRSCRGLSIRVNPLDKASTYLGPKNPFIESVMLCFASDSENFTDRVLIQQHLMSLIATLKENKLWGTNETVSPPLQQTVVPESSMALVGLFTHCTHRNIYALHISAPHAAYDPNENVQQRSRAQLAMDKIIRFGKTTINNIDTDSACGSSARLIGYWSTNIATSSNSDYFIHIGYGISIDHQPWCIVDPSTGFITLYGDKCEPDIINCVCDASQQTTYIKQLSESLPPVSPIYPFMVKCCDVAINADNSLIKLSDRTKRIQTNHLRFCPVDCAKYPLILDNDDGQHSDINDKKEEEEEEDDEDSYLPIVDNLETFWLSRTYKKNDVVDEFTQSNVKSTYFIPVFMINGVGNPDLSNSSDVEVINIAKSLGSDVINLTASDKHVGSFYTLMKTNKKSIKNVTNTGSHLVFKTSDIS